MATSNGYLDKDIFDGAMLGVTSPENGGVGLGKVAFKDIQLWALMCSVVIRTII
jgi:hypothetical protein